MKDITPEQAKKHPNWDMGEKITIDSSTMMNKIFEYIEAIKIFKTNKKKISIIIIIIIPYLLKLFMKPISNNCSPYKRKISVN